MVGAQTTSAYVFLFFSVSLPLVATNKTRTCIWFTFRLFNCFINRKMCLQFSTCRCVTTDRRSLNESNGTRWKKLKHINAGWTFFYLFVPTSGRTQHFWSYSGRVCAVVALIDVQWLCSFAIINIITIIFYSTTPSPPPTVVHCSLHFIGRRLSLHFLNSQFSTMSLSASSLSSPPPSLHRQG